MSRPSSAALLGGAVRALAATWQVEFVGRDIMLALRAERRPRVSVVWHEHLVPLLWGNRGCGAVILASRHNDGRRLAAVCRAWGYDIADGSSTRGAVGALRRMIRVLQSGGEVAVAADGPRGPRRTAKPGAVFAAQRTGAVIVAVAASASRSWRLSSWDRMLVPAPFAQVRIVYGEPAVADGEDLGAGRAARALQERLECVAQAAEC